jgi:effector-binding domain-containing protein
MAEEITLVELTEQHTAVVRDRVPHDGIADFLGRAFGSVMGAVAAGGRQVVGTPFARYTAMDESGWDIEAGFPVDGPVEGPGVESGRLPGGPAVQVIHRGSYDSVATTWHRAEAWMAEHGHTATEAPWESYLDGPEVPEPRTLIVMPCDGGAAAQDAG